MRISYYATPAPEILHLDDKRKIEVSLIKNGNIVSKNKSSRIDNNSIILSNTCLYDSIVQALACAHCDSQLFAKVFDENKNAIFKISVQKYVNYVYV